MKNVNADHIRKVFVFNQDEFKSIVDSVFGNNENGNYPCVGVEYDGISVYYENDISIDDETMCNRLSEYFDITVILVCPVCFVTDCICVMYME